MPALRVPHVLISPYGAANPNNLYLSPSEAQAESARAKNYPSWDLTPGQLAQLELLLNGGYSPLSGFMNRADYESVVSDKRLANGLYWPLPIVLDVTSSFAKKLDARQRIALRDGEGVLIAVMQVEDMWLPDKRAIADRLYGDEDLEPRFQLLHDSNEAFLGGRLFGIASPHHYDFRLHRHGPQELREAFAKRGWSRVAAFQTADVMHRADVEASFRAARDVEANLLIHGLIAYGEEADAARYARVRCYQHTLNRFPRQTTMLSLLPAGVSASGPRADGLRAIVARNFGCSHVIVDKGQHLDEAARREVEVQFVAAPELTYVKERNQYIDKADVRAGETPLAIDRTEIDRRLNEGVEVEEWASYPEVIAELRKVRPPRSRQGFTVFFTGLSGAGKSTLANALRVRLLEMGGRHVTLLDGDIVRKNLSSELGFSREHRDLNIIRIGFVASEITKNGGVAICAPIAPYTATRRKVREMVERVGGFIEVHVATPIQECERRDRKGLYAKARAGLLKGFTGVDDPYEVPERPEFTIDTSRWNPEEAVQQLIVKLERLGYIELL